ncbi:prolipoprotein diacylglyceryl transferase [Parvularcula bermudensis HTCC2503]|uniref:Phosphatidylglycerol--prolipoprotein diacylglyceryl transferase n=1 Tax=Parvularcula bermudensis (strain ATCC BAA-594 / HTCC2503 / KCTC 12087) TaxID=314260 RepID=E0TC04_PARBH|nr:prolipoprotein diacylglyceryl transferase [Parvularcula bermudensis]ADM09797.1 prolipoprotein diacylglyceryl transferase [Parvularcula bermudensis HTCC2503]
MPYPNIDPVFFSLGPLQIRWYALAYIAGIVLGWMYLRHLLGKPQLWQGPKSRHPQPPIGNDQLDDVLFYVTLGIIFGGRLGFVLFYRPELLWAPWEPVLGFLPFPPALAIWQGGMSFHGGALGVAAATVYFARKEKVSPLALGDLFAAAAPIGLFFGRIANFINAELYGRPSDVPWAVTFPSHYDPLAEQWRYAADAVPRHPSQLYEAALEGLVLFVILRVAVTRFGLLRFPGATIALFLSGYGAARFFVEFFREPDTYDFAGPIGFLTRGMMLSLPMVLAGAWLFWWSTRHRGGASV